MSNVIDIAKTFFYLSLQGVKDNFKYQSGIACTPEESNLVEEIRKDGVTAIPNYYSPEQCDAIVAEMDKQLAEHKDVIWKDEFGADQRIFGSEALSDLFLNFYNDPFFHKVGSAYHQAEMINSNTMAGRIEAVNGNAGSGGGWHRDSVFQRQYKSIVYLTDVDEEHGPFQYLLGTHDKSTVYVSLKYTDGFIQNRLSHDQVMKMVEDHPNYKLKTFTAKKGTVLLVDTRGIHRGKPIQQGHRYALTNYFYPAHHYTRKQKERFDGLKIENRLAANVS